MSSAFADRLAALVEERRSQVCLGLDPDPRALGAAASGDGPEAAAAAVEDWAERLIAAAGASCVAVKPQLACFERLGWAGWRALERVCGLAREAGLLVVADGKRGDVPVSAEAYGQALFGPVDTPWGELGGLRADAATINPLLGGDAIEPLVAAADAAGSGLFCLVRTSNPGAADLLDAPAAEGPLFERLAAVVADRADRLRGVATPSLSGMGAVVGATAPEHLARLRALMPDAIFLVPGVGAQGGAAERLGPAFSAQPASVLVPVSRGIAGADDPATAASGLRDQLWAVAQTAAR